MANYEITNTGDTTYTSTSLTLDAGESTVLTVDQIPVDLNAAIVAEILVVTKLAAGTVIVDPGGGGGGGGDPDPGGVFTGITHVIPTNTTASLTSQTIAEARTSRISPGVEVINNTYGDVAIRCANEAATFVNADVVIQPGEKAIISADYLGPVNAICESSTGSIAVRVYY